MLSDSRVFQNGFYYPDLTHVFILNDPLLAFSTKKLYGD